MGKRDKYILVLSIEKDYLYGAFENTDLGEKQAKKYVKEVKKSKGIRLYLKIK